MINVNMMVTELNEQVKKMVKDIINEFLDDLEEIEEKGMPLSKEVFHEKSNKWYGVLKKWDFVK